MIVGLGMDVVEIARLRALLDRHAERARHKLFTAAEIAYADARTDPARHFAARFAAKEAAFKALALGDGARRISWLDIEVVNERDGRPTLRLHGVAAECARGLGVSGCWITITHGEAVAAATVVLERGAPMDGAGAG